MQYCQALVHFMNLVLVAIISMSPLPIKLFLFASTFIFCGILFYIYIWQLISPSKVVVLLVDTCDLSSGRGRGLNKATLTKVRLVGGPRCDPRPTTRHSAWPSEAPAQIGLETKSVTATVSCILAGRCLRITVD